MRKGDIIPHPCESCLRAWRFQPFVVLSTPSDYRVAPLPKLFISVESYNSALLVGSGPNRMVRISLVPGNKELVGSPRVVLWMGRRKAWQTRGN